MTDDSVPLREHLERLLLEQGRRFDDLRAADKTALEAAMTAADKAVRAALEAAKEAVVKAEGAVSKQLALLNELRTGVATDAQLNALAEKVDAVRKFMFMITGMGVVISIVIPLAVSLMMKR